MDNQVKKVLAFARKLVGVKYKWWTPNTDMNKDQAPFWVSTESNVDLHNIDSIACTGILNLIYRKLGKPIPGIGKKNAGSTWIWLHSLKKRGVLKKFSATFSYPAGTLLLAPYKDDANQGHVAILYRPANNVFDSLILHSYSETPYTPKGGYSDPGVVIEKLGYSHFAFDPKHKGYFEYVCLPQYWLKI